jgi:hypothetical protein
VTRRPPKRSAAQASLRSVRPPPTWARPLTSSAVPLLAVSHFSGSMSLGAQRALDEHALIAQKDVRSPPLAPLWIWDRSAPRGRLPKGVGADGAEGIGKMCISRVRTCAKVVRWGLAA